MLDTEPPERKALLLWRVLIDAIKAGWFRKRAEPRRADVRATLACAADHQEQIPKPSFTTRWAGKFSLPAAEPEDTRLTFLLERYERNRK